MPRCLHSQYAPANGAHVAGGFTSYIHPRISFSFKVYHGYYYLVSSVGVSALPLHILLHSPRQMITNFASNWTFYIIGFPRTDPTATQNRPSFHTFLEFWRSLHLRWLVIAVTRPTTSRFLTVHTRFFLFFFFLNVQRLPYHVARHFHVNSFPFGICAPSRRAYAALPLLHSRPFILSFDPSRWRFLGVCLFGKRHADVALSSATEQRCALCPNQSCLCFACLVGGAHRLIPF